MTTMNTTPPMIITAPTPMSSQIHQAVPLLGGGGAATTRAAAGCGAGVIVLLEPAAVLVLIGDQRLGAPVIPVALANRMDVIKHANPLQAPKKVKIGVGDILDLVLRFANVAGEGLETVEDARIII